MSGPSITELLEQLHSALEHTPAIAEKDRELLRQLARDIQAQLAQPDGMAAAPQPSAVARVQEAVVRFEVTHPELTGVLASVSKALSDMGI